MLQRIILTFLVGWTIISAAPLPGATVWECDFESGACGVELAGNVQWRTASGATTTWYTGPAAAKSGKVYYYVEANPPMNTGNTASFRTPSLDVTGNACVRFAFIMYGKHVGQLKVNGRAASGVEGAPWWAEAGDQGNSWFERNLDVSLSSNSQVVFTVTKTAALNDKEGDIAIDALKITAGRCSDQPPTTTPPTTAAPRSPCNPNPCQNSSPCEVKGNFFQCVCKLGYVGRTCALVNSLVGPCTGSSCQNGGTCQQNNQYFTCACRAGYGGDRCQYACKVADIVFALDSSGSIGSYNWTNSVLNFTKNIVSRFDIGMEKTRVGYLLFGSMTKNVTNLDQTKDKADLLRRIDSLPFLDEATNTSGALYIMKHTMFQVANGDRPTAPSIAVVMTDGASTRDAHLTIPYALALQQAGVRVYSIGIGDKINNTELAGIANDPDYKHMFYATFDSLNSIMDSVYEYICENIVPATSTTPSPSTLSPNTTPANNCASNPCRNGGTCQNTATGFVCNCTANWGGTLCERARLPCDSSPCKNGGTCSNLGTTSYLCTCPAHARGTLCELVTNRCISDSPCKHGSTCINDNGIPRCNCTQDWQGPTCEEFIGKSPCASEPCQNSGRCTRQRAIWVCVCPADYTGKVCENKLNGGACASYPCQNNGTCVNNGTSYYCKCHTGYSGTNCQNISLSCYDCNSWWPQCMTVVEKTGVANVTCAGPCFIRKEVIGGSTQIYRGCAGHFKKLLDKILPLNPTSTKCMTYQQGDNEVEWCICGQNSCNGKPFYTYSPPLPCKSDPCQNGGSCIGNNTYYQCVCPYGYSGPTCAVKNPPTACDSKPCQNGATCSSTNMTSFTCSCLIGYRGLLCESAYDMSCYDCNNGWDLCKETGITKPSLHNVAKCKSPCYMQRQKINGTYSYFRGCMDGVLQVAVPAMPTNGGVVCKTVTTNTTTNDWCFCPTNLCNAGGWAHIHRPDSCKSNPCLNGGTCSGADDAWMCTCTSKYTGTRCENVKPATACDSNPCVNGATCTVNDSGYQCTCALGYGGATCSQVLDLTCHHCAYPGFDSCPPGGVTDLIRHQVRGCRGPCYIRKEINTIKNVTMYYRGCAGDFPELPIPYVPPGGSSCIRMVNPGEIVHWCMCPSNLCNGKGFSTYAGTGAVTGACASGPCKNGGSCAVAGSGYTCSCTGGYSGTTCQTKAELNACSSTPCKNNAVCQNYGATYSCQCKSGFSGTNCEKAYNLTCYDCNSSWEKCGVPGAIEDTSVVNVHKECTMPCYIRKDLEAGVVRYYRGCAHMLKYSDLPALSPTGFTCATIVQYQVKRQWCFCTANWCNNAAWKFTGKR